MTKTGAHKLERATFMSSCHGVFSAQFIFRMILARISDIFLSPTNQLAEPRKMVFFIF